jgi:hypothetical protein
MGRFAAHATVLATLLLAALAASPLAGAALADTPAPTKSATRAVGTKETALQRIQRSVARINQEAGTPEGEAAVLKRLAAQLRVGEDSLRARRQAWAIGYGEVAMVYGFARAAKRQPTTPEQVVEMRRSGKEWDAIAKELGVKIDTVASRIRRQEPPKGAKM